MIDYPDGFDASLSRKPICGVLAVAIAAGVSYGEAHRACKDAFPSFRKRFGGRTFIQQRLQTLFFLNAKFRVWKHVPKTTLSNVVFYLERDVLYMIDVAGHCMVIKNGLVVDQYDRIRCGAHNRANSRVKRIIEIL